MSGLKDYELFIFDWDGTLSTSTLLVSLSRFFQRRYRPGHVMKHREEYASFAKHIRISEDENMLYSYLYDLYSMLFKQRLKKNALDVLRLLRRRGKRIAIFSDSERYRLLKEVRLLGVLDYVDFLLSASSIGYYKPNPAGLLLILDKYGTSKAKSVYIGDMATDIITAGLAGISSCAIADGLGSYGSLKEMNPRHIFRDLSGLLSALKKGS